jgi:hypothetical protein
MIRIGDEGFPVVDLDLGWAALKLGHRAASSDALIAMWLQENDRCNRPRACLRSVASITMPSCSISTA